MHVKQIDHSGIYEDVEYKVHKYLHLKARQGAIVHAIKMLTSLHGCDVEVTRMSFF
jgi:hypothetical protein